MRERAAPAACVECHIGNTTTYSRYCGISTIVLVCIDSLLVSPKKRETSELELKLSEQVMFQDRAVTIAVHFDYERNFFYYPIKKVVGYVPPIRNGKSNILLLQKNKAKEIGCKKITKIKRGVGYRRKDVV